MVTSEVTVTSHAAAGHRNPALLKKQTKRRTLEWAWRPSLLYNKENESELAYMSFPDEPLKPEEPGPSEEIAPAQESFSEEPVVLPEGFTPLGNTAHMPRSRRRRAHRMLVPPGADERAALLDGLARRAFPSFEFFLFALLCGAVLGAAYLLDSPALLLLGILLAPLLTPWIGLTLATLTGSWLFFFQTLGGTLVASSLVFLTGALAGIAGRLWMPLPLFHANIHSHLWWPDLFLVALGAALLAISFVRSEQKPILPSIMLAYGLFLPISAAGVGLGIGATLIWPDGALVFLVHLALATFVGGVVLASLHFRPVKASGYILPFLIGLLSLTILVIFTGLVTAIRDGIIVTRRTAPTPTTLALPSITATALRTSTPSLTLAPSDTPLPTDTFEPTPSYAIITSSSGGGALVRTEPGGGTVVATLINGSLVQVLPEIESVGSATWVRVRLEINVQGWVLQTVLSAATLTSTPTSTLTPTPTP